MDLRNGEKIQKYLPLHVTLNIINHCSRLMIIKANKLKVERKAIRTVNQIFSIIKLKVMISMKSTKIKRIF